MTAPKLIAFAGSTRKGSLNRAVVAAAAEAASNAGATVELIDLADYEMPIYNGDLETDSGIPETALALKAKFREADGFIIASPEYNSAFSPLLKNTIDWCSRAETDDEPPLAAYSGKTAMLLAASPGALGGLRGLYALRTLLQNINVTVFPDMLAVRSAFDVVGDNGEVTDERWKAKITSAAKDFVSFASRLSN
ncbi:MAG: FMN reductase [Verrucomicrobiales bacterium]|nr:FMN reductase [Verrucomicrobiales bacterium]